MRLADLAGFAVGALAGHRLRTGLSVLGVAVGVSAVVALTALGEGARRYVVDEFMALGTNLLIVVPGRAETTGGMPMPVGGVTHDLTLDDYQAVVTRVAQVRRAAPLATGTEEVRFGSLARSVVVFGTTSEMLEIRRLETAAGRFLSPGDPRRGGAELVLGARVADEIFGPVSPLGAVVRAGEWRFRVIGVLKPHGNAIGFDFDDIVIIPVATAMRMFNRSSLFRILIEVRNAGELGDAKTAVGELIAQRHRAEDVTLITQDAVVSTFSSIFSVLTMALAAIASVSLTVAGIGIMNVMLVAVAERRREIGLLKALGAGTPQILGVFLAESIVLATIGGALGLAAGWGAVLGFVRVYPSFPATPPAWAVVAAVVLSVGVGVVFGVVPARRAAGLDPVVALAGR